MNVLELEERQVCQIIVQSLFPVKLCILLTIVLKEYLIKFKFVATVLDSGIYQWIINSYPSSLVFWFKNGTSTSPHPYNKITGCLAVPEDLANRWTYMVLFYSAVLLLIVPGKVYSFLYKECLYKIVHKLLQNYYRVAKPTKLFSIVTIRTCVACPKLQN